MQIWLFLIICIHSLFLHSKDLSEWTILTYIQANNDLAHLACYSMSHMQSGVQNSKGVNVLVHWDENGTNCLSRHKIIPGDIEKISSTAKTKDHDNVKDLVDSMKWAQDNYPAKRYALIFWDHGSGVIDYERYEVSVPGRKRSILYDDALNKLLTNENVLEALTQIKSNLGKKIDLVIMDACFMAMFEIAYQIKDCADFLVASQEAESAEGLPYGAFLYPLTLRFGCMNSFEFCKCIVDSYDKFYKHKEGFQDYTFSAIDLSKMESIRMNMDSVVDCFNKCHVIDSKVTFELINDSRKSTHEYYWNDYVDLYSFYCELSKQINKYFKKHLHLKAEFLNFKRVVDSGKNLIKSAIISNAYGTLHHGSNGMSIYYPINETIHPTYFNTLFALDSHWTKFLTDYSLVKLQK